MFHSYADVTKWFTPRNPAKGKQLTSLLRMYVEDGLPTIYFATPSHKGEALCCIYPDDTVKFVASVATLRARIVTVGSTLPRIMRFWFARISKGRYACVPLTPGQRYGDPKGGYEYFPGLKFNLNTRVCLNPLVYEEDPERKKLWLACLRKFKNNIRTRAKIGALDTFCASLSIPIREKPQWDSEGWRNKLYGCIRNNTVDHEILKGFAASASPWPFWGSSKEAKVDGQKILDAMNWVCDEQSRAMRVMFGALRERRT
jgi:hypothetical protein